MAKLKLKFTDEHIMLIKWLKLGVIEVRHVKSNLDKIVNSIRKKQERLDNELDIEKELYELERISKISKAHIVEDEGKYVGIDTYDLFGVDFWWEKMATIFGCSDKVIKGTEEDVDGPKYPDELIEHFKELDDFIVTNLVYIEEILHQFCDRGGIKAGETYISYDYERIWHTEEEWKNMGRH